MLVVGSRMPRDAESRSDPSVVWVRIDGVTAITVIMLSATFELLRHAEEQDVNGADERE
jgi:hypothetical protein